MIGPLSSPALVKKQVIGVFDKTLLEIFANALKSLDIKFAWIVNSDDGLDEISPYAKTNVMQLKDNEITEITIDPKKLKINADKFENLRIYSGTIFDIEKDIGEFDFITIISVIEHTSNDTETLLQATKYLKPGGIMLEIGRAHV